MFFKKSNFKIFLALISFSPTLPPGFEYKILLMDDSWSLYINITINIFTLIRYICKISRFLLNSVSCDHLSNLVFTDTRACQSRAGAVRSESVPVPVTNEFAVRSQEKLYYENILYYLFNSIFPFNFFVINFCSNHGF